MSQSCRGAFLEAADGALSILSHVEVWQRWEEESILPPMTVGELASHLARGILQVELFLDAPLPTEPSTVDAVEYYARLEGTTDPDSQLNVGVRMRSAETASVGPEVLARTTATALNRVRQLLDEVQNPLIAIAIHPGEAMLLDEYLRTRCVELTVHTEDLALNVGAEATFSNAALAVAVDVLFEAARKRWGDDAVLHALARRERDTVGALRVL